MTQTTLKLDGLKVDQLKAMAKATGKIKGYSKMDKPTLITELNKLDPIVVAEAYSSIMEIKDADEIYPFATSDEVPSGIYCHCGANVPVEEDGTFASDACSCGMVFDENVDMDTIHGNHRILHPVGSKPQVCPLDGDSLSDKADTPPAPATSKSNDGSVSSSRNGNSATAELKDNILTYENSAGVSFSVSLAELDNLRKRFGESYNTKALVKSIELPCVPGCDSTWSPRASFMERVLEAIRTGSDVPFLDPSDPRHEACLLAYKRSCENMLTSARPEKIESPTAEELSELRKLPWTIEDGRVYHNNGDPAMAFSFDVTDAEENPNATAHLHKCHGPRCKSMIRTYAGWALEQARKAEAGEHFAFISSFAPKHDSCKQQAKDIRDAERSCVEEEATEPAPAPKVETPAPAAPVTAASEPAPVAKVETPAPAAPVTAASEPAPVAKVEDKAPVTQVTANSEMAQVILALGSIMPKQNLGEIAQILEALPAQQQIDIASVLQAAASITDKQTATLGDVAKAAQNQLGDVVKKLIEERAATVRAVDDIPRRVRSEIFGDMDTPEGVHEVGQRANSRGSIISAAAQAAGDMPRPEDDLPRR